MLNVADGPTLDPEGKNASSPLLNVNCRRALAFAIDQERYVKERGAGLVPPANGPFPPGSPGYLDDTGYPQYDPEQATAEMDTCLEAPGTDHIEFSYNTSNDPFNVESNALIISMWTSIFGDEVRAQTTPVEQGQYIGLALVGSFNAVGWRSHSGVDPDIPAAVVAEQLGHPDRAARLELRALPRPRDGRATQHHQVEPRSGRPPSCHPGGQPDLR